MTLHVYQTELVINAQLYILPLNVHIRIFSYEIF